MRRIQVDFGTEERAEVAWTDGWTESRTTNSLVRSLAVEPLQKLCDLLVCLSHLSNCLLDPSEGLGVIGLVNGARLVLLGTVVLNLLASILDFCQAKCRGGALKEVAELGQFMQVGGLAGFGKAGSVVTEKYPT